MVRKILYLEDNDEDFLLFREVLRCLRGGDEQEVFFADHARTPNRARALMAIERYDVIVVDIQLGAESGIDFVHELWRKHEQRPMILTSGLRSVEFDVRTVDLITRGRLQFLSKYQMDAERLSAALQRALNCSWRVLICDGGQQVSAQVAALHRGSPERFDVHAVDRLDEAKRLIAEERFDACLIDNSMPGDWMDELLWSISRVPDQNKPAVIFAGSARAVSDPPMIHAARAVDLGLLRLDEAEPDTLSGVIGRACGESQWRTIRAELHS